ncbi:GNAT family N-acetyltransferase [Nocardioides mesophilus]|uniref:GNAT family N-acetyltransferase n=1 Tax=Nocardioides mesophilus TaxID=433659 RepID=A0A7G9R7D8_9ACTN|nr:GNAT family protein [Nocardioides mesophilus]QNN51513.1 GNAT family N-acetyltransferase [Nocardioides mesophilus]
MTGTTELSRTDIRPVLAADWRAIHSWAALDQVCRYQAWGPNDENQTRTFVADAVSAWSEQPRTRFVYVITSGGAVIGNCELNLRGHAQAEIGYGLHPDHWGHGHATSAVRKLLELGFVSHGVHRIFATCDPRNVGSASVLQRVGMTYEGRLRETVLIRDGWRDSDVYSLLAPEWRPEDAVARP